MSQCPCGKEELEKKIKKSNPIACALCLGQIIGEDETERVLRVFTTCFTLEKSEKRASKKQDLYLDTHAYGRGRQWTHKERGRGHMK